MSKAKQKKILYLDILRALACLIVVLFHSKGDYTDDIYGMNFLFSNVFEAFARIGVPLFVMISGALMLDEEYECTAKKLFRHVLKMVVFYVVWSAIYALQYVLDGSLNFWGFMTNFILGPYHLWFVPMIIGLYLILPLLRLWVKSKNKRYVEYFLILAFCFGALIPNALRHLQLLSPAFSAFEDLYNNFHFEYALGYTGYFILGWYLNNYEVRFKKLLYMLGAAGVLVTAFGTVGLSRLLGEYYSLSGNFQTNVIFYAIAVFLIVKSIYRTKQYSDSKAYGIVDFLCKHSLGIYAIHAILVPISRNIINLDMAVLKVPVEFLLTLSVSIIIAFIVRKIPIVNKIV